MTPEKHAQAMQLEQKHRQLVLELKQWKEQAEPPAMQSVIGTVSQHATSVPSHLWLAFKKGMIEHLFALIEANRKAFEAL